MLACCVFVCYVPVVRISSSCSDIMNSLVISSSTYVHSVVMFIFCNYIFFDVEAGMQNLFVSILRILSDPSPFPIFHYSLHTGYVS